MSQATLEQSCQIYGEEWFWWIRGEVQSSSVTTVSVGPQELDHPSQS